MVAYGILQKHRSPLSQLLCTELAYTHVPSSLCIGSLLAFNFSTISLFSSLKTSIVRSACVAITELLSASSLAFFLQ